MFIKIKYLTTMIVSLKKKKKTVIVRQYKNIDAY